MSQAQTMANFFLAFEQELAIVPVLNKADLPSADPEAPAAQMQQASRRCLTFDEPIDQPE